MSRLAPVTTSAVLALGLLASGCGSPSRGNMTIVLDRSIRGVALGESRVAAERQLGHGLLVSNQNDRHAHVETRFYRGLNVTYVGPPRASTRHREHAAILDTRDPRFHTAHGLGVGSPWQDVRALIDVRSPLGRCSAFADQCQHGGNPATGGRLTVFFHGSRDRVSRIVVLFGH
jgi:hypothetical protein